jgi:glucose-1-phosphate cytidylyltransferase
MTGGRLKRIRPFLGDDDLFCCTYGDGVADVDVTSLVEFHRQEGRLATVTAAQPPGRFGALNLSASRVDSFTEKPHGDGGYINAGFFVLSPAVLDYVEGDDTVWEKGPMERLAREGQLSAFLHTGFWQPMDTLRDKLLLEESWNSGHAPWKVW